MFKNESTNTNRVELLLNGILFAAQYEDTSHHLPSLFNIQQQFLELRHNVHLAAGDLVTPAIQVLNRCPPSPDYTTTTLDLEAPLAASTQHMRGLVSGLAVDLLQVAQPKGEVKCRFAARIQLHFVCPSVALVPSLKVQLSIQEFAMKVINRQYSSSSGVLPIEGLSIAGTVDLLTQEVLVALRHRCTLQYAAFASVIDRLRELSTLLLDQEDLFALVEGDEMIMMLSLQLSRSHLLGAVAVQDQEKGSTALESVLKALARSKLAFQAHQRIDDLVEMYLPGEATDWKTKWEQDCEAQLQYYRELIETSSLRREIEDMSENKTQELILQLRYWRNMDELSPGDVTLLEMVIALLGDGDLPAEPDPEDERPQVECSEEEIVPPPWQEEITLMKWLPQRRPRTVGIPRKTIRKEFIPAHEINFQTAWLLDPEGEATEFSGSPSSSLYQGTWLDTLVAIQLADEVSPRSKGGDLAEAASEVFAHQVRTWFYLNHPNVLKLFGGCDDTRREIDVSNSPVGSLGEITDLRFFVCEYTRTGTLRQYLKYHRRSGTSKPKRMLMAWTKLYEAALGLKYLHQRGIIHGRLRCREILVGNDEHAKLTVFGGRQNYPVLVDDKPSSNLRWTAPERLGLGRENSYDIPSTMEADVFALGMCIIEAMTLQAPWKPFEDSDVRLAIMSGSTLPPRPEGVFTNDQWNLIAQMCSPDPRRRPNISVVVHRLETMMTRAVAVEQFALTLRPRTSPGMTTDIESHNDEIDEGKLEVSTPQSEEYAIADMLSAVQSMLSTVSEYSAMNEQLGARILDIYSKLRVAASPWSDALADNSAKPRQWWIRAAQHHIREARNRKAKKSRRERIVRWMICSPSVSLDENASSAPPASPAPPPSTATLSISFAERQRALSQLAKVLKDFHLCLLVAAQEPAETLAMLCASRTRLAQEVYELHSALDQLLSFTPALYTTRTAEVHNWQASWEDQRGLQVQSAAQLRRINQNSDNEEKADAVTQAPVSPSIDRSTSAESAVQLPSHRSSPSRRRRFTMTQVPSHAVLATMTSAWNLRPVLEESDPLPEWFVPPEEVLFNPGEAFSRGAFGTVHKGKWLDSHVVVKNVIVKNDDSLETFRSEVAIWYSLNHPHIVNLFGACHLGRKPFFVCEEAEHGQLVNYLRRRKPGKEDDKVDVCEAWRKLYEAALGLQYLHERGIIHQDLKCDNILVGKDGRAKLADFGLSANALRRNARSLEGKVSKPIGAVRWKAPELLKAAKENKDPLVPSMEADIFGFGMCIVQAVSGKFPWGRRLPDPVVAYHVKKGKLPPMPKQFKPSQWKLVTHLCAFEPSDRPDIGTVVKAFGIIVSGQMLESSLFI